MLLNSHLIKTGFASNKTESDEFISDMSERNRMGTRLLVSSNNYDPSQSPVSIGSLSDPVWKTFDNDEGKTIPDDGWIGDYSLLKTFYTKDTAPFAPDRGKILIEAFPLQYDTLWGTYNWTVINECANLYQAKTKHTENSNQVLLKSSSATLCNEGDGFREAISPADSAAKMQQKDSFENSTPNCVDHLKDAFSNFYFSDDRSLGEPKKSLHRPQTAVFNGTTPMYSKASSSRQLKHERDDPSVKRKESNPSPINPVQIDVTATQFPVTSVQLQSPGDAASVSDSYNQYLKWKILFAAAENNHSYVHTQIDNPVVQQLAAIIATNPYVYNLLMVYLWQQNLAIQRHKTILQILQKQQMSNLKKQSHQRNSRRRFRSSLLKDQNDDRLNNNPKQRLS